MNSTSASLYGSSPSPGGVGWRRDEGALAQPPATAAAARHVAIASRHSLLITTYRSRFTSGLKVKDPSPASKIVAVPGSVPRQALLQHSGLGGQFKRLGHDSAFSKVG